MYQTPDLNAWKGRIDTPAEQGSYRWHQVVRELDLTGKIPNAEKGKLSYALLGFCCDEGVRRNLGRIGAKEGPTALRKQLRNLAVQFDESSVDVFDAGDVICPGEKMEAAQEMLAVKVNGLLGAGYKPVLLGGGHEIAYGHFRGAQLYTEGKNMTLGIINLDAHFDLRQPVEGGNSGTPFLEAYQFLSERKLPFRYVVLGIQESGNTRSLFKTAGELNVQFEPYSAFRHDHLGSIYSRIETFAEAVDGIYLTFDLDVINQAFAPGVSAPAPFGLMPETLRLVLQKIIRTGKVLSIDIAELNPLLDHGDQTARLAAWYVQEIIREWSVS